MSRPKITLQTRIHFIIGTEPGVTLVGTLKEIGNVLALDLRAVKALEAAVEDINTGEGIGVVRQDPSFHQVQLSII